MKVRPVRIEPEEALELGELLEFLDREVKWLDAGGRP